MKTIKYRCDRCDNEVDNCQQLPEVVKINNNVVFTGQNWDICDSCMQDYLSYMQNYINLDFNN